MATDVHEIQGVVFLTLSIFVFFFAIQRISKTTLDRDQYQFLKDICLMAAWGLCGIWSPDPSVRLVIAMGLLSAIIGVGQRVRPKFPWLLGFFIIGVVFASTGLGISFIGFPGGEFLFLNRYSSILATALWVGIFPLLLQEMDQVPGLAGFLSAVTWIVMLIVTGLSRQHIYGAFYMTLVGVVILAVFWSRHGHSYRRLGEPVAALWGTLIAGTSIMGVSKGVTFSTLMLIPLGLFAIPMVEASFNIVSRAFSSRPQGTLFLYRRLVSRGMDHTPAVRAVGSLCAVLGAAVASFQLRDESMALAALLSSTILLGGFLFVVSSGKSRSVPYSSKSYLWGTPIDSVSDDYALGRIRSWVLQGGPGRYIVTLDALSALRAKDDSSFRQIVRGADLVLPDGRGLTGALNFLGTPVLQRIPGVDFVERMCRLASIEGWPVFFLGGAPGVANKAAEKLRSLYPGLVIGGIRHGYIEPMDLPGILEDIRRSGSRFIFVGMGVPRQEYWIGEHHSELDGTVSIGVGGSFDVISGNLKRAPLFLQKAGLEWLFRLVQEPWRWSRVRRLPLFVFHVILTKLGFSSLKGE
ncbi:MAG: Glycosyl transferase, WecB/TagA/CpsF family [Synergistales bacterium 58_81]|nr:MAG: Glycosyl transferase, WecB/TagA/CpsF family [Synergistales bacterium 58_81]